MTKTITTLALAALVLAGCSSNEPVDSGPLPEPTLSVTTNQSITDLLLPPTDAVVVEVPKGSLGVFIEDYAPQPVMDTFLDAYLPEEK